MEDFFPMMVHHYVQQEVTRSQYRTALLHLLQKALQGKTEVGVVGEATADAVLWFWLRVCGWLPVNHI